MKIKREITIERTFLPGLAVQINELHKTIDGLIEEFVADNTPPGVPASAVRQCLITSKTGGCRCAAAKLIADSANLLKPNELN